VIPVVYTYLASRTIKRASLAEQEALAAAIALPKRKRLQAAE
jgi:hypothetical protein